MAHLCSVTVGSNRLELKMRKASKWPSSLAGSKTVYIPGMYEIYAKVRETGCCTIVKRICGTRADVRRIRHVVSSARGETCTAKGQCFLFENGRELCFIALTAWCLKLLKSHPSLLNWSSFLKKECRKRHTWNAIDYTRSTHRSS